MVDHFPGATKMVPTPPSRADLAAVLAQAGEPDCALLADRPVAEIGWGMQSVSLASGWTLRIWWLPDQQMGPLHGALAPDGGAWAYGCDRWPDWNAGPDAVVLDPLRHLITPEQRARLQQRLLSCSCWPEPDPSPEPPSMSWIDGQFPFEVMAS